MRNWFPIKRGVIALILITTCSLISGVGSAGDAIDSVDNFPVVDNPGSIRIDPTEIHGQVGDSFLIQLNPLPYPPPPGFFYSAIVDVLEKPEGEAPQILPGDRDISVYCPVAGTYLLRIRVNLIAKSSCGGAQASILDEQEVRLLIEG